VELLGSQLIPPFLIAAGHVFAQVHAPLLSLGV
jgi:hypothetical protein